MAANLEQIASMFRVTYSKAPADGSAADAFVIDKTASEWLWWWYRYLRENRDYEAYCEARRIDDGETCVRLEEQFERIAEVYSDWGDIHRRKPMHRNEASWQNWLFEKRHLFFVEVAPIKAIELSEVGVDNGGIAIQIPATVSKDELLRLFSEFVEQSFTTLAVSAEPKYLLHAPQGRIDQSTFHSLKKAFYVNQVANHHVSFPATNAGTALEIMAMELKAELGFNWELDEGQEEALLNGSLSMLELDAFKRQVARYKAQYDAYVANTIHGVFPKKELLASDPDKLSLSRGGGSAKAVKKTAPRNSGSHAGAALKDVPHDSTSSPFVAAMRYLFAQSDQAVSRISELEFEMAEPRIISLICTITELKKNGRVDGDLPEIAYYACFRTEAAASGFISRLRAFGYHTITTRPIEDGLVRVDFSDCPSVTLTNLLDHLLLLGHVGGEGGAIDAGWRILS